MPGGDLVCRRDDALDPSLFLPLVGSLFGVGYRGPQARRRRFPQTFAEQSAY